MKLQSLQVSKAALATSAWLSRADAKRVRGFVGNHTKIKAQTADEKLDCQRDFAGNHLRNSTFAHGQSGTVPVSKHYRARTIVKDSDQDSAPEQSSSSESEKAPQEEETKQPPNQAATIRLSSKQPGPRLDSSKSASVSLSRSRSKPSSWAALQDMPKKHGAFISGPPVGKSLADVAAGGGAGAAGYTDWPSGYTAPAFEFNATQTGAEWFAKPTLKTSAAEGTCTSMFTSAGKHKTSVQEGGKDVYWNFSPAISTLVQTGEQEHCDDHAEAYKISLKEAEDIIKTNLVGKVFGPKAAKPDAEALVLAEITSKLTHPGLGNDQTKWAGKYSALFYKSLDRDTDPPGWHSIVKGARSVDGSGNVVYEIEKGSSQIGTGTHLPPTIIKY